MQFIWLRNLGGKYSETMHKLLCQIELNESKSKTFTIDDFEKIASQKFTAFYFCVEFKFLFRFLNTLQITISYLLHEK